MVRKKLRSMAIRVYQILFRLIGFLPAKKNLIVFESYLGKQYSSNPRAIYEYLSENHPEFEMVWSIDKHYKDKFDQYQLHYVSRLSIKWLFMMPRATYWVTNTRLPYWIRKPRHTTYLQTWHGTPLKKLAADIEEVHMPGTTTETYKENFYKDTREWDFLLSPNPYSTKIFQSAFQVEKSKVLETGYPRNDYLIQHNQLVHINKIKVKLGIPLNKKVILYAPTWRDDEYYSKGKYKFSLNLDLDQLQNQVGEDYVVVFRLHYLIANRIDVSSYKGFVFDFSNYDDIRELYLISDLLITDYSSVFFDYLCLKRPIIFYTYDIESYREKVRGFYFDIEKDAPGPLVKTTEQVIETIKQMEQTGTEASEAMIRFHQTFCMFEKGVSTENVVKSVFLERATG
jgi:CDP-glycerol glycerophosphotransferase